MFKLYEINNRIESILSNGEHIDPTTGEWLGREDLDRLDIEMAEKIESTLLFIKNTLATATALKTEADALSARAKSAHAKAENAKAYLAYQCNGQEFSSSRASMKWRKSEQVEITSPELIPNEFTLTKTTINKAEIKKALKRGEEVQGAKIINKNNIQIG